MTSTRASQASQGDQQDRWVMGRGGMYVRPVDRLTPARKAKTKRIPCISICVVIGEKERKTYQAPHQKRSESDVRTVGCSHISTGLARSGSAGYTEVVRHSDRGDIGDSYHDGDGVSKKEKQSRNIRGESRHEVKRGIRISAEILSVWLSISVRAWRLKLR